MDICRRCKEPLPDYAFAACSIVEVVAGKLKQPVKFSLCPECAGKIMEAIDEASGDN